MHHFSISSKEREREGKHEENQWVRDRTQRWKGSLGWFNENSPFLYTEGESLAVMGRDESRCTK